MTSTDEDNNRFDLTIEKRNQHSSRYGETQKKKNTIMMCSYCRARIQDFVSSIEIISFCFEMFCFSSHLVNIDNAQFTNLIHQRRKHGKTMTQSPDDDAVVDWSSTFNDCDLHMRVLCYATSV